MQLFTIFLQNTFTMDVKLMKTLLQVQNICICIHLTRTREEIMALQRPKTNCRQSRLFVLYSCTQGRVMYCT